MESLQFAITLHHFLDYQSAINVDATNNLNSSQTTFVDEPKKSDPILNDSPTFRSTGKRRNVDFYRKLFFFDWVGKIVFDHCL